MTNKIVKGFVLSDEDIHNLDAITKQTSMNNSEVIRYLIKKCLNDKTEMMIIMQNFLDTEGERVGVKRKLRIMSDRTRIKKSCMTQRTQDSAVSSNCLSYSNQETTNNQLDERDAEIMECIQIAKAKWIED